MADVPKTWTFAFNHGTKSRDECTREELLYVIDSLAEDLRRCRETHRHEMQTLFTRRRSSS